MILFERYYLFSFNTDGFHHICDTTLYHSSCLQVENFTKDDGDDSRLSSS